MGQEGRSARRWSGSATCLQQVLIVAASCAGWWRARRDRCCTRHLRAGPARRLAQREHQVEPGGTGLSRQGLQLEAKAGQVQAFGRRSSARMNRTWKRGERLRSRAGARASTSCSKGRSWWA